MTMVDTFLGIDLNLTPFQKADDTPMNDDTVRELNKMKSENKKLRELLSVVWDNDNYILQNHVNKLMLHQDSLVCNPNKRKLGECDGCNSSGSAENDHRELLKRSNNGVTRVYRRRDPSDKSMIVEDGYEWRKYGQKVTRDNPAPRAYYKCSFAPTCPVKKKVQRSVDDECLLVAIYVGEHNHDSSEKQQDNETGNTKFNSPVHAGKYDHEMLVEQMANSLRRNSDFIQELANEIFTRILECRSF